MTMWVKRGFQLPADRLTLSATSTLTLSPVPSSVRAALVDPNYHRVMKKEFAALITNNNSGLIHHPVGSSVVTDKWIFKYKFNSDGSLKWYKTHWVLHDFTQRPNVDYDETFGPVVKPAMVHTMLFLVVSRSWLVHQIDVKNVFLHGTLSEIIYCSQPTGFIDPVQPDHVCNINKSLYRLKQVPQAWYIWFVTYHLLGLC
jgi:hypothetical protein